MFKDAASRVKYHAGYGKVSYIFKEAMRTVEHQAFMEFPDVDATFPPERLRTLSKEDFLTAMNAFVLEHKRRRGWEV